MEDDLIYLLLLYQQLLQKSYLLIYIENYRLVYLGAQRT